MLIDFVGAIAAGMGLMGLVMLVNRLILRGLFGRWIYPATVAVGMVGFTVWAEYTWPQRTLGALPQLVLVSENGQSVFYRPWTYVWPQVTRMVTINQAQSRTHPDHPGQVMTQVVLVARWQPMQAVTVVFDCAGHRRADLADGVTLNADGSLEGATWLPIEADDASLRVACSAVEEGSDERTNGA